MPILIILNGQVLPLTTQVEQMQNVVEFRVKTKCCRWTAAATTQVRHDKLREPRIAQFPGNALPWWAVRPIEH